MACHPHGGAVWSAVRRTRPYRFTNAIHFRSRLMPAARWIRWSATVIAVSLVAAPLSGQRRKKPAPAPAPDTTSRLQTSDPVLRALHWRLVGPYRGGRTVAVAGDPAKPLVFYFGAVDGGVWKTGSGGQTWRNITDGRSDIASVGALAVAPSDPNVLYVGSGEADWREDLTYGDGMWRSAGGGRTWSATSRLRRSGPRANRPRRTQ